MAVMIKSAAGASPTISPKKTWDVTGVSMTTCCGDVIATF